VTLMEEKGDVVRFDLAPRGEDTLFEILRVGFKGGKLREMALLDNLGQRTRIYFSDVKLNPSIPAGRFVFTPPPGTDVIREAN
jgi:outer membrane lipoprotein carrier protein